MQFDKSEFKRGGEIPNSEFSSFGIAGNWIAVDISEGEGDDLYTISLIVKNPNGYYSAFYVIESELLATEMLVDPMYIDDYYVIPKSHPSHPYNIHGETTINKAILESIFNGFIDIEF